MHTEAQSKNRHGTHPDWVNTVARRYGWDIVELECWDSLYRANVAYRLTLNHSADLPCIVLKPFRGTRAQLDLVAACATALWNAGFHNMPKWLTTSNGASYVTANHRLFYAVECIEGTPLSSDPRRARAVGRTLAKLHRLSATLSPSRRLPLTDARTATSKVVARLHQQELSFRKAWPRLAHEPNRIGSWFRLHGTACDRFATQAFTTLSGPAADRALAAERRRPAVIHGDVTRPNILLRGATPCLIDWDRVRPGSTYFELAKTLANVTDLDTTRIAALLDGYEQVRPLSANERAVVSALFRCPREAWFVARRHGRERQALFDILEATWKKRVAANQLLAAWVKRGRRGMV